jgi:beta-glucosidase
VKPTKEELKIIKENTINFLGLNYYSHQIIGAPEKEVKLQMDNEGKKKAFLIGLDGVFQAYEDPNVKASD